MRYFTDEHNVIWSENGLRDYYNHLLEIKEIDYETFPTFGDWFDEVVNRACTFEEMKVSDYDRLNYGDNFKESDSMEINLLYVDKKELPSVLTSLIKHEYYKMSNHLVSNPEGVKAHIDAEIEKTRRVAKSLYRMLSILKSLFNVKYDSSMAYKNAIDCDMETELLGQIDSVDDNMEEEIGSVICTIGKILEIVIPNFKLTSNLMEEWFFEDSDYIDVLMKWSNNLEIEML